MAIQWMGARAFTCVAADTKPTTNTITGTYALETDTFYFYRYNGASWDKEEDFAETFTNKTIDAEANTIKNTLMSPFAVGYTRTGFVVPAATAALSVHGACQGWPTLGTFSIVNDASEGYVTRFNSAVSGDIIGYKSTTTTQLPTTKGFNGYIKARVKASATASMRVFVGFSSLNQLTASNTILATTDSGVLVGFDTANANFSTYNNNGGGSAQVVTSNGIAKDTSWHTFEVTLVAGGNPVTKIDGANTVTCSTRPPADATVLYANCVLQLATASSTNFDIKGLVLRSDK